MAEIKLHGVEIEFDKDNELCFDLPADTHWFYLNENETRQLRDFLNQNVTSHTSEGGK